MTERTGYGPASASTSDNLTGDFLWSCHSVGEARPAWMMPLLRVRVAGGWGTVGPVETIDSTEA
jgi:hypothetical protein